MAGSDGSIDTRVSQLAGEVRALADRLDLLTRRVDALAATGAGTWVASSAGAPVAPARAPRAAALATVLSTAATVSFVLVIALALRTIVDNGIIDRSVGTWAGIAYAALIVALGHARHGAGAWQGPVYSTCGALLLFAVVTESHVRFETLSTATSSGILVAAMALLSATGFRFSSPAPLVAATLGGSLVAIALDYPRPAFILVAPLVLLGNVLAFSTRGIPGCAWLRWASFAVSMGFWSLWTTQLRAPLLRHEALPPQAAAEWFLPAVAAFALCYVLFGLWSFARDGRAEARFAPCLVVANVVWAYAVAAAVAGPLLDGERALAAIAVVLAAGHALGAWVFARPGRRDVRAVLSLTWAALILLALALTRLASPSGYEWAVIVWSAVAAGLGVAAAGAGIQALRVTAHLYQAFALAAAAMLAVLPIPQAEAVTRAGSLLALSALCVVHYWACRRGLAGREPVRLALHPGDRLGVMPLLAGLVYLFAGARVILHASLASHASPLEAAFQPAQSILINAMALGLMTIACVRRDGELFVVGLAVGAVGAARVFGYDLLTIQGLPLVCSVLSFGLATALASLLWRTWQRAIASDPVADRARRAAPAPPSRAAEADAVNSRRP